MNYHFNSHNLFFSLKVVFVLLLFTFTELFAQQNLFIAEWSEISNVTKPWTRWWWHGSAVTKEEITSNLEELSKSGIGGVEITPIYGVKGFEDKDISFLSTKWMEMLQHTLKEGKRLNLGIDLANASGWPFGGPWISLDDACKNVQYKIYVLKEGENLKEKIEFIQEPLIRAVGHKVDISEIKFPISENENLQELALDQVKFRRKIPFQAIVAFNEKNESIDLTNRVDEEGNLNWTATRGNWKIYAVFQGWHGKMVERAGKGGEGNVIDHFSEIAANNFLNFFDSAATDFDISGIRAFFNDSYEVDDAQGEADWTPLLFEEFEKLRGYNLKHYLPALFGNDSEENNKRVICDYRETISDLLLERFTKVWLNWSRKYNSQIRNQAHGSPANIIDLYDASDIPETEGTNPLRIKMASSAGNISGKSLIACEASTWLQEHFLSSLSDVKNNIDRYFANGVNHIVYHGTPYSPIDENWPGWLFYASVHFAPTNTWWEDFKTLNSYITNCQSFLQSAKPANDILLYFPIYDAWSTVGKTMLRHFGKDDENLVKELSEYLLNEGYTFDFISDRQIQQLKVKNEKLVSGDIEYKTIIIPKTDFIPLETFSKIIELTKNGAKIIFENDLPNDVPGLFNLKDRQKDFQNLKNELQFVQKNNYKLCEFGKGKLLKGNDINLLLNQLEIVPEIIVKDNLWFRRVNRIEGTCYFICNWSENNIVKWIKLNSSGKEAIWFNPMNKIIGKAKTRNQTLESSEVFVQLEKGETLILQWYPNEQNIKDFPIYEEIGDSIKLISNWEIEFIKGGHKIPKSIKIKELKSWTEYAEEMKWFSGTAKYSTEFNLPNDSIQFYNIDLGKVHESAVVFLNGEKIATLIGPNYNITVEASKFKSINKIEVLVTNLMANRIIKMDKNGENYKKFYNINFAAGLKENMDINGVFTAENCEPIKSGLLGPVYLKSLKLH
ncbi:MAG: glycosyl hydrolase [Melioribacteraceae bacterium]